MGGGEIKGAVRIEVGAGPAGDPLEGDRRNVVNDPRPSANDRSSSPTKCPRQAQIDGL